MHVWLIKPAADERDGAIILRSRVGLEAPAEVVPPHSDIYELYRSREKDGRHHRRRVPVPEHPRRSISSATSWT